MPQKNRRMTAKEPTAELRQAYCRCPDKSASRSEQDGASLMADLQVARVVKRIKDQITSSTSPRCDLGDSSTLLLLLLLQACYTAALFAYIQSGSKHGSHGPPVYQNGRLIDICRNRSGGGRIPPAQGQYSKYLLKYAAIR